jgi:hypothetical protein
MSGLYKTNKFLAVWIAIPIFLSYSVYFFPMNLKSLLSPIVMTSFSSVLYIVLVFLVKPRLNFVPELWVLIFFFVILFLGLIYTNATGYGLDKITILYAWILVFYFYGYILVNNFNVFLTASLFTGFLFLFFLFQKFGDPISFFNSMQGETVRLGEAGLNPIWVARYLGFLFLLAIFYMHNNKRNIIIYAYLTCLFLYMITSGSKGPIVSLIGGCAVYFADSKLASNIKSLVIFLVIAALLIALLNSIDFFTSQFFISRFSGKSTSGQEREELIEQAIKFRTIPSFFFGNGTGNFGFFMLKSDTRLYPHNIIAELYYENGVVGVSIVAFMFYTVIRKYALILKYRSLRMMAALFFYFALNAFFSGDLSANEYFFISFILVHYEAKILTTQEQYEHLLYSEDELV